jgi:Flp pilus assembly pilin Flp
MQDALIRFVNRIRTGEQGQALGEFALILAFIAIGCLVALTALGGIISAPFEDFIDGIGGGGS